MKSEESFLKNREKNNYDVAIEALSDYYESFPDIEFGATDLMELLFWGAWVKYGLYEYSQEVFHKVILELKRNDKKNSFIGKITKNINFRYIIAQQQMMSDEIYEAITLLQNSNIISLDAGNNYKTFKYLLKEKQEIIFNPDELVKNIEKKKEYLFDVFGVNCSVNDINQLIDKYKTLL